MAVAVLLIFFVLRVFIFSIAFQGSVVTGQHVQVTPVYSIVKIGDPITMLCQASGALTYCKINIPGEPTGQILVPDQPPSPKKLQYQGTGLDKGQCGFRIEHAEDVHNGVFMCHFHISGTAIESSANMSLVVARTPSPPEITIYSSSGGLGNQDSYKDGDILTAKCTARNGRPATNLTWYLDDQLLEEGRSNQVAFNNDNLLTTEQNLTITVQATDNGKQIKCIADHPGLDETNRVAKKQLVIKYPPKPLDKKVERFGLVEGMEGRIAVAIEANPRPRFEWNIGEISIFEGDHQDRFSVLETTKQGPGTWETVLLVDKLTKQDVDQSYSIKASNEYGNAMYYVDISTSPEPKTLPFGDGPIITIVIVAAVLFLAVAGVIFARRKGKCCFSGVISPSSCVAPAATGGESSDTESAAADHPTCQIKAKPSFISAVFKKNSCKLPTTAEQDDKVQVAEEEEANKQTLSSVEEENGQGEGVVYAELDIQRRHVEGPDLVRGEDDKTEYAEIIHSH